MATENPRVAAYPPQQIYERLIEFKREQGFKSDSAAIVAILESYFYGDTPGEFSELPKSTERLDDLEVKLLACLRMYDFSGRLIRIYNQIYNRVVVSHQIQKVKLI